MRKHDLISSILWFIMGLSILLSSISFGLGTLSVPGPGFMSFLAGAIICVFSAITFLGALFSKSKEAAVHLWAKLNYFKLVSVLVLLFAYVFLIDTLGFIISTLLLVFLLMRFLGSLGWFQSLLGAILTTTCCYFIFDLWLRTSLPKGVITSWIF